jgi:hypothetical protein
MRRRLASLQTVLVWLTLAELSLAERNGAQSLGRDHERRSRRQLFRLFSNRQEEGESGTTTTIISHPLPSPSFPTTSPQPSISTTLTNTTASPPFKADRSFTTFVNVDAASGIDVYTSYCPGNDTPSVSNGTMSSTSISNSTRTPIVVTQVIAFQYQLTIQPESSIVEIVHDLERRLQTFLALWYLNCTTSATVATNNGGVANKFAVTKLQSSPVDKVGAPCASGVARCRMIHGMITAAVYYPIKNSPLSRRKERVLLLRHSNEQHEQFRNVQQLPSDNATSDGDGEAVATILTDFIVAESFGRALSLFFENNRTDHNRSLIANLEYLAITNFASSDQPTYEAVDKINGDATGAASSIKGTDFSSPADNGSVQYSWGAAVLGMAILGLIITTFLAWRRHRRRRRHSNGPNKASGATATLAPEDSPTVSLRQPPRSIADQRASAATRTRSSSDSASRTKQGSIRTQAPPIPFSAASHDENASERIDLDSTVDYTKKHAFVLGDDYWDDNDYDSLSDAELQSNSIEVHYHDRSGGAAGAAEMPPPPVSLRPKNSNPPQFVSTSFDDESNVSVPSTPGKQRYDPYGSREYSTPDTMNL